MPFECPYCRRSVDPRAEVCPHCTSDIAYKKPHTPVELLKGVQGTAQGLGWELFLKLIVMVPFLLLTGIPLLPVIVIVGGIYFFYKLVLASISSTIDSAKSQKDSEQRSDKDSQGNSHE
jgi:hypothetical protein